MAPFTWIEMQSAYIVRHVLQQSGKTLLAFFTETLYKGDLGNLQHELGHILDASECDNDVFCEQENLLDPISTYNINLLVRILKSGCGLAWKKDDKWSAPQGVESWNYDVNGAESLEFLLALMMNMVNHQSNEVEPIKNVEEKIEKITKLFDSMMTVFLTRASELNQNVSDEEKDATIEKVKKNVANAKENL